ncbi:MAG: GYD domain-containing protein [Acidobacteria bacterium]|nr:GYD domain-containing protein [Acidobacteriota bacterium]
MAHYVCLVTFTDQGVRNLRKTTARARAFQEKLEKHGIVFKATLWTVGQYDIVHIFEAPDDKTAATFAYTLYSLGNVRTHTLRGFTAEEMDEIISRVQTPFDLLVDRPPAE